MERTGATMIENDYFMEEEPTATTRVYFWQQFTDINHRQFSGSVLATTLLAKMMKSGKNWEV